MAAVAVTAVADGVVVVAVVVAVDVVVRDS